jgi:cytochrome c-type biogenesis protein CcmE
VVSFDVTDGDRTVGVVHRGEVPDTLKESTDVIAEGTITPDGTVAATRVLAKCSSKFVPADRADEHLGRTASG